MNVRWMLGLGVLMLLLCQPGVAGAGEPFLLKDVNQTGRVLNQTNYGLNGPRNMCNFNGTIFFTASDYQNGEELWKSDGTATGTMMVHDIYVGSGSSYINQSYELFDDPQYQAKLVPFRNMLFFAASDGFRGRELWKTDGTWAGTAMIKDINPSYNNSIMGLGVVYHDALYFSARDPDHGIELWKTDGTAEGTVLVKDLAPGLDPNTNKPADGSPNNFIILSDKLYFVAKADANDAMLWQSDGTAAGTVPVTGVGPVNSIVTVKDKIIIGGHYDMMTSDGTASGTSYLASVNGHNLLVANDDYAFYLDGSGVCRTDGTTTQTIKLKSITSSYNNKVCMVNLDGRIYFVLNRTDNMAELWKTDGTVAGTVKVREWKAFIQSIIGVNGKMFMGGADTDGYALWCSDGTAAATVMVKKDLRLGSFQKEDSPDPYFCAGSDGTVYFSASGSSPLQYELWKSDGTASGTVMVRNIMPDVMSNSNPRGYNINGSLYFTATDNPSMYNSSLWKSNGTAGSTILIDDFATTPLPNVHAEPQILGALGDQVFYIDYQPSANVNSNQSLFVTNGQARDAIKLRQFDTITASVFSAERKIGYLAASDPEHGNELWNTDGTTSGTNLIKDIDPGADSSLIGNMIELDGICFFSATDGVHGEELWRSDGTDSGTVMIKDLLPGETGSHPQNLTILGQQFLFLADDGTGSLDLWRSDGAATGTQLLKDLGDSKNCTATTVLDGRLALFVMSNNGALWCSDGTVEGTRSIDPSAPIPWGPLVNVNREAYYVLSNQYGSVLCKTDGTTSGTVVVKASKPGPESFFIYRLGRFQDKVCFIGYDEAHGQELWISDGTENGTHPVIDLNPGPASGALAYFYENAPLCVNENEIFYTASDGVHGLELWRSDGTAQGTVMLGDIAPGHASSTPMNQIIVGHMLYFSADDGSGIGRELWAMDLSNACNATWALLE